MTAEQAPQKGKTLISRDVAARVVMVSPKHLDRLVRDGWIRRAARGKFDFVDVVQGYIRSRRAGGERPEAAAGLARVMDARARELEHRIAEKDARLIEVEEHEAVLDEVVGMVEAGTSELGKLVPAELRAQTETEVRAIIQRVRQRLAARNAALGTGEILIED